MLRWRHQTIDRGVSSAAWKPGEAEIESFAARLRSHPADKGFLLVIVMSLVFGVPLGFLTGFVFEGLLSLLISFLVAPS